MIPKIIHYCWFGPNPKTEEFQGYLETWKKLLPDYEIREWNESNFDASKYLYSREASRLKSYAHVSDVCRLYALYNYGGIYLDTDVELLQSFNPFLKYESFLGTEVWMVGTGVIGSEAGQNGSNCFLIIIRAHTLSTSSAMPFVLLTAIFSLRNFFLLYPHVTGLQFFRGIISAQKIGMTAQ